MIRDRDWSSTSLGPPDTWSVGLRLALGVCLTSNFPMLVAWGPELLKFYNDGYRAILGTTKHPMALGAPAKLVWPEIWDVIGPLFASVMSTGEPTWVEHQLLPIERNGYLEECYFTYSYSPLFESDGSIQGTLDIVTETTDEVIVRRRLAALSALGASLVEAEQVTDVCLRAAAALASSTSDIQGVDIFLDLNGEIARVASSRRDESTVTTEELADVARTGEPLLVGSIGADMPAGRYVVAIGGSNREVQGVLTAALHPMRPFDGAYADYVRLIADAIGAALDNAYRRTVEVGEYRRISDTLQAAMLKPASDLPTVAARYLPATGNLAVGGDWYDVIDIGAGRRALVVGDCVGHGLEAATVMAQLRSAARAMLLEGRHPAGMLDGLDLFAASLEGAYCATVVCAIFDHHEGVVTYSRAGHPPPLLISDDGPTWLDQGGGPPLAVSTKGRPRRNATYALRGDDVIILYSDGLIERRGETLDEGFDRLAGAAAELYGSGVQAFADGLIKRLLPEHASDDVVVVVKQLPIAGR